MRFDGGVKRIALLMALNLVGGAGWSTAWAADLPLKAPMMPNYQFHTGLVVGAEAMFDWLANEPTNFTASNLRAGTAAGTINNRWTTTVTGKVGFAWDRLLGYGKVGGAWVGQTNNALTVGATSAGLSGSSSGAGWT